MNQVEIDLVHGFVREGATFEFVAQMMDGRPHGRKIGLEHSA